MSSLIKTYLNEDVRLFELNEEDQSLVGLKNQICGIYGQEGELDLKFIDEDGDMITLSTDEELKIAMSTCNGKSLKLSVFVLDPSPLLQPMGLFDTNLSSSSSDSEEEEDAVEDVENNCEAEEDGEMKVENEGELRVCFQLAAQRLQTFYNVNVSGEQLKFLCSALNMRPRRFVKSGLIMKEELQLNSLPSYEIVSLSKKPSKRILKEVNPKASDMLNDALLRYGTCDLSSVALSQVLLILDVRPKRFVKVGLMSREEHRQLKEMNRFGFDDGPNWEKRGCRGRRGGGRRGCRGRRGRRGRRMHGEMNSFHPHPKMHHHPHHQEMHHHHGPPPHGPPHHQEMHHHHGPPHHQQEMHHHHGPPHHQQEMHHHHRRGDPMKGRSGKALCRFVGHSSHPDHSEIPSDTEFVKVWRVRNDGEVDWPSSVSLSPSGRGCRDFGAVESVEVEGGCSVGEEREVSFPLVAPPLPGLYECMFRLVDNSTGKKFGQSLWVKVMVLEVAKEVPSEEEFVHVYGKK